MRATFFVAFLAAILASVSGQLIDQTYSRITSGTCSSNGLTEITSSSTCSNAGCALATSWADDSTATSYSLSTDPPGCYFENNALYYNSATSSTSCSSSIPCVCSGTSGSDTATYTSGQTCGTTYWTDADTAGLGTGLIVVFIVIPILIIVCIILICIFCCGAACFCCAKAAQQPAPAAPVGAPQYAQATTAPPQQTVVQMQPPAPPPAAAPLPAGWVAHVDPASGKTFYVAPDQSTHWELPQA